MCRGIECGLREVKETGETDDQAIDFAKGGETKDFGGVVAVRKLAMNRGKEIGEELTRLRCSTMVDRGRTK
jgi:hypothetical protein